MQGVSLDQLLLYLLPRQQALLSQGVILHSKPLKLSLNWSRIVFVLFVQSPAQQTPTHDLVLMYTMVLWKAGYPHQKLGTSC